MDVVCVVSGVLGSHSVGSCGGHVERVHLGGGEGSFAQMLPTPEAFKGWKIQVWKMKMMVCRRVVAS